MLLIRSIYCILNIFFNLKINQQNQLCIFLIIVNNILIIIKVEMDSTLTKPIIDAYKTIGCFVHGPKSASTSSPFSLAAACHNSFKIYSDQLAIKMVSPVFNNPILALHIYNDCTYILVGTKLIKMKYHHVVRQWVLPLPIKNNNKEKIYGSMLVYDGVIVVSYGNKIYLVSEDNLQYRPSDQVQTIEEMNLGISIIEIVQPVNYVNKILAYSSDTILLINPISQKLLYNYSNILSQILTQNKKITIVKPTPLTNIIAVCFNSGDIVMLDIFTSSIVKKIKQKRAVTAIAFTLTDSFMASGDQIGNIILWDLQNGKIVYRLQSGFVAAVDGLFFVPGYQLLMGTSSLSNSIKQFRINLDDSKTLLQFRQRSGCPTTNPIIQFKCQNNKQLTFSTKSSTVFTSLYSHTNMYTLPYTLDSSLPYHIVSKNFCIQLYRQRTQIGKLNIHENATIAKISLSKKFVIIGTKTRIIKIAIPGGINPSTQLHIACQWKINDPLHIILNKQHFIYVQCFDAIHVLNFNQPTLITTINQGQICFNPVASNNQNMLAIENRTKQSIQIWDMRTITLSRSYLKNKHNTNCTKLCFSADNRYLLSAHQDHTLLIWSILQSNLYKVVKLEGKIVDMNFTPDNGYLLSIFEGAKEINIWHNYIGKITSTQSQSQVYKFQTTLNYLTNDYRQKLGSGNIQNYEVSTQKDQGQLDDLLDQIQDSNDPLTKCYDFTKVSKWMPLVFYDQIKNRNSINNSSEQVPALPFFLDFKNISEEQQKITNQLKQQSRDKKRKQNEKVDAQLSNDLHEIRLKNNSKQEQFQQTWRTLTNLSVAEVDYQLRRFLLLPGNLQVMLKMFNYILSKKQNHNQMLLNILLERTLEIAGTQICSQSQESKQIIESLLQEIKQTLNTEEDVIQRCIAVSSERLL